MKSRTKFQQRGDPAVDRYGSAIGWNESRNQAEKGAFAGPVTADDADAFSMVHAEGDISESIERLQARATGKEVFHVGTQQKFAGVPMEGFPNFPQL
jgi:hypothetical protein